MVAGGNGNGSRLDQLNEPRSVIVDEETNTLIISDYGNRRVVRWSRENNTQQGETLLDSIHCNGLALDGQRNLYVSDAVKQEVRRYRLGEKNGTLVAGGNGMGSDFNQLHDPLNLLVDREQNVYVSDNQNHRVMKWAGNGPEGLLIAGGQGIGTSLEQLSYPDGIVADSLGTLYVVENDNHRLTRWRQGAQQGVIIAGGNGPGFGLNQLNHPFGLALDRRGDLYVVDTNNGRIQRFSIQWTLSFSRLEINWPASITSSLEFLLFASTIWTSPDGREPISSCSHDDDLLDVRLKQGTTSSCFDEDDIHRLLYVEQFSLVRQRCLFNHSTGKWERDVGRRHCFREKLAFAKSHWRESWVSKREAWTCRSADDDHGDLSISVVRGKSINVCWRCCSSKWLFSHSLCPSKDSISRWLWAFPNHPHSVQSKTSSIRLLWSAPS